VSAVQTQGRGVNEPVLQPTLAAVQRPWCAASGTSYCCWAASSVVCYAGVAPTGPFLQAASRACWHGSNHAAAKGITTPDPLPQAPETCGVHYTQQLQTPTCVVCSAGL